MILRLSQKLNSKIKTGVLQIMPLDQNPFADWSAHLFVVDRTQYILVSNTKSLYSIVMYGKGITNDNQFIQHAFSGIREFMEADGLKTEHNRFIAPEIGTVHFAKALNRSVTGSMNELTFHASLKLKWDEHSLRDVGFGSSPRRAMSEGVVLRRRSCCQMNTDARQRHPLGDRSTTITKRSSELWAGYFERGFHDKT